jgi:hypothetical protein
MIPYGPARVCCGVFNHIVETMILDPFVERVILGHSITTEALDSIVTLLNTTVTFDTVFVFVISTLDLLVASSVLWRKEQL